MWNQQRQENLAGQGERQSKNTINSHINSHPNLRECMPKAYPSEKQNQRLYIVRKTDFTIKSSQVTKETTHGRWGGWKNLNSKMLKRII